MMEQVRVLTGGSAETQSNYAPLSSAELLRLGEGSLLEIGAHTVTHPLLATIPIPDQRTEILRSKGYLEGLLGRPVSSFSYPHGSFSDNTPNIVRETGFDCACTSFSDVVCVRSDRFQLPRFWVPNCDGSLFAQWLRRWLRG
jgi:peptidoglycan/xylan/chitin deacetylase (PgdA/CDA1 family)